MGKSGRIVVVALDEGNKEIAHFDYLVKGLSVEIELQVQLVERSKRERIARVMIQRRKKKNITKM